MDSKVIYRAFYCHLCDKPYKEFINSTKLRNHLEENHGIKIDRVSPFKKIEMSNIL